MAERKVGDRSSPQTTLLLAHFLVPRLVVPADGVSFPGDIGDSEMKLIRSSLELQGRIPKEGRTSLQV